MSDDFSPDSMASAQESRTRSLKQIVEKILPDTLTQVLAGAILLVLPTLASPPVREFFSAQLNIPLWAIILAALIPFLAGYFVRARLQARRRKFAADKIGPAINVMVSGEGEGVTFWKYGPGGDFRCWLVVSNFLPVAIEIDRIVGDIVVGSPVAALTFLKRQKIEAFSRCLFLIESELNDDHLGQIKFQRGQTKTPRIGLELTIYVQTDGQMVELRRSLTTTAYQWMNFDLL